MRCLERNEQKFYYALYVSKVENADEEGDYTGEYTLTYGEPTAMYANISPNRGSASLDPYGVTTAYSKTIVTDRLDCPIDENTRLWIGTDPYVGETLQPHNYIVSAVSKSLNSIEIAIEEVDVS